MNRSFLFKVFGILFLVILMAWALSHVNDLIIERQMRQESVNAEIAKSSAGYQTLLGPVLVVPYTEEYSEIVGTDKNQKTVNRKEKGRIYVLPETIQAKGGFTNEYKSLGIFKSLMYQFSGNLMGEFNLAKNIQIKPVHTNGVITIHEAYLSMGLSDPRGISGSPHLIWNKQTVEITQGSQVTAIGNGIHANLGLIDITAANVQFSINMNVRGMEKFNFVPIANNNIVSLNSNWKSPHFDGSFLPEASTQKIDETGFKANWAVSSLASNIQEKLLNMLTVNASVVSLESIGVGFVEPINIYSQADRATKYGLLFIGLTFAGFFVFEVLKQLRIHPAQYTLVGLAMALFYLLLVSLSEHISFAWSYCCASLACISLLGYYLSHVLQSKVHGLVFASMLTALYGALYGILASEDNALLMGSLLVFGLLALTMILTRKVDWYDIGLQK
ncbi:MAG: cell envelope integrity protein CreD [Methylophilaceae bacterium]